MSWVAVGMAGVGLLKGATVDKQKEKNQAMLQAETTRWSPWTKMQAKDPDRADPVGLALAGAGAGLAMNQNNEAFKMDQALKKKSLDEPYSSNIGGGWGNSGASNFWSNSAPSSGGNEYNKTPWGIFGKNY